MRVGIISDTHGLLRPEAERALDGVKLILHAGDVGDADVLTKLKRIAPVFAVRGNVDTGDWAEELPWSAVVEAEEATFYVLHNLRELNLPADASPVDFVITGHTHQAKQSDQKGIVYLNPGSAGPRRFHLPVTLALLDLGKKPWRARIVELDVAG